MLGRVSEHSNSPLAGVPITGCIGDQQSAMVGQKCFGVGDAKTTYGTGAFTLINTGNEPCASNHGLLTTVLYQMGSEKSVQYVMFERFDRITHSLAHSYHKKKFTIPPHSSNTTSTQKHSNITALENINTGTLWKDLWDLVLLD